MHLIDLTLPTLVENLALDEALLRDAQAGGPATLRFWRWHRLAVVVGAGGVLEREVDLDACRADGVPVVRRGSGGGSVVLGPGCFLYSLVVPMNLHPDLADLNASYRFIMRRLADALGRLVPDVGFAGTSDLIRGDRKFSGNSQQRKRTHLLHHGTILDAFDLDLIDRYLKHPPRMPDYRRDRPHRDFVDNLQLGEAAIREALASTWDARELRTSWPEAETRRLVEERYGRDDWHARR